METLIQSEKTSPTIDPTPPLTKEVISDTWEAGTTHAYGLQGICTLQGIETRTAGGQTLNLYRLEKAKSPLSRSQKQEPAIWVPVADAQKNGLRRLASRDEAEKALNILSSADAFFPLDANWTDVQPQLELAIRLEGIQGLSKSYGYLKMLERRQIILQTEISRFMETLGKVFHRELCEALRSPLKAVEAKTSKAIRTKILSNN